MTNGDSELVLAAVVQASVRELAADHVATVSHPDEYAALTVQCIGDVLAARQASESRAG